MLVIFSLKRYKFAADCRSLASTAGAYKASNQGACSGEVMVNDGKAHRLSTLRGGLNKAFTPQGAGLLILIICTDK
jgi:hypothetical protein